MLLGLIGFALLLGILSLRRDGDRLRYTRRMLGQEPLRTPSATVIVPIKGADEGLGENLAALAQLDYPDYELILVAQAPEDMPGCVVPACARIVIAGNAGAPAIGSGERSTVLHSAAVVSPPATGEKIRNLMAGVAAIRPESEVIAFADSDGLVPRGWLKALIRALEEPGAGAATGYRHYLPDPPDFWSQMRGVWNAVIAGGFGEDDARFAWGGAMAIRRDLFERLGVLQRWRGLVSDDYALSAAVHSAGLRIVYAPGAQVVSTDHIGPAAMFRWIQRQLVITRIYARRLWAVAVFGHAVYCGGMAASVWLTVSGSWLGPATLLVQLCLAWWKGARRLRLFRAGLPEWIPWLDRHGWAHIWLTPVGTWIWMTGLALSATTNTIVWRGYRYRLLRGSG